MYAIRSYYEKWLNNQSIIKIDWEEHNLKALLDLLRESWIKIDRIIASNPDEWALKRSYNFV